MGCQQINEAVSFISCFNAPMEAITGINGEGFRPIPTDPETAAFREALMRGQGTRAEFITHLPHTCRLVDWGDPGIDCEEFIFGTRGTRMAIMHMFPAIRDPKPGDAAFYCNTPYDVPHVGRLEEDGLVISKWGNGPIIRHPLDVVPVTFGELVCFRRANRRRMLARLNR